jgi:hypothetical protein
MSSAAARRAEFLFLLLLTLTAFGVRYYRVGSASLAEDEVIKWQAIREYKQGHFVGTNSEHPVLLKLLAWGSLELSQQWNRLVGSKRTLAVREEVALRLPNLIVGALTTIVLYFLGRELIGRIAGGSAAVFWALTPLPVALNRVLKEDTLATLFTYVGFYFFLRGKKTFEDGLARRYFTGSGACFGLALASKYYLNLLVLNPLIWYVAGKAGLDRRPFAEPFGWRFWLTVGLVFVAANPVVLSLSNDLAMIRYLGERTLVHHGYNLNGHLYWNSISATPFGIPWYFYLWVLAVKTPLPVLGALAVGLPMVLFGRSTVATIFLRILFLFCFVPLSLVAPKWIRYLLIMLPFLYLMAGYTLQKLYDWIAQWKSLGARTAAYALGVICFLAVPAQQTLASAPNYGLYLNALGGGRTNTAKFFPHDELYDLGVREAVEYVCATAPAGTTLAVSNPHAVGYYLGKCNRTDLHVGTLYDPRYILRPGDYLLIQESRRYFETDELYHLIEHRGRPLREIWVDGVVAVRVFRF